MLIEKWTKPSTSHCPTKEENNKNRKKLRFLRVDKIFLDHSNKEDSSFKGRLEKTITNVTNNSH